MTVRAILFDLDGTLLDRDSSLIQFARDQYDRFPQLQVVSQDAFVDKFVAQDCHGNVWKDKVYQQLIEVFGIEGLAWQELLDDYLASFQRHCIGFPNLKSVLTALKEQGIRMALVSNGYGQFQYDNFKALGIGHLFDEVLVSEWEGLRKPDPAIFQLALSKLGVEAGEALFVGDHPDNDIRASREVGMRGVWKRNNAQLGSSTAVEADASIDDFTELLDYVKQCSKQ
ncbi:HAD-superfamily hydrolase, subfamily IA, variant 1 [Paenibacillus curdlanolyticus YK9]|uniref:HAD-superfamily hydrolase, subfamily IA, variant 1 n=1 Tax=Paenibacillus curdlanolyticus YK9 TaxID=717606 RepID=E0ICW9_9BACL|nr:HAD family hydrolase [Paenibacillus curdlanolyticus]EFM09684.1 HAD-superfamily hydrolase, subfamily IA, variant 1 [Paenibacillus curdlanolyticus YK9]